MWGAAIHGAGWNAQLAASSRAAERHRAALGMLMAHGDGARGGGPMRAAGAGPTAGAAAERGTGTRRGPLSGGSVGWRGNPGPSGASAAPSPLLPGGGAAVGRGRVNGPAATEPDHLQAYLGGGHGGAWTGGLPLQRLNGGGSRGRTSAFALFDEAEEQSPPTSSSSSSSSDSSDGGVSSAGASVISFETTTSSGGEGGGSDDSEEEEEGGSLDSDGGRGATRLRRGRGAAISRPQRSTAAAGVTRQQLVRRTRGDGGGSDAAVAATSQQGRRRGRRTRGDGAVRDEAAVVVTQLQGGKKRRTRGVEDGIENGEATGGAVVVGGDEEGGLRRSGRLRYVVEGGETGRGVGGTAQVLSGGGGRRARGRLRSDVRPGWGEAGRLRWFRGGWRICPSLPYCLFGAGGGFAPWASNTFAPAASHTLAPAASHNTSDRGSHLFSVYLSQCSAVVLRRPFLCGTRVNAPLCPPPL